MNQRTRQLLQEALEFEVEERGELARELVKSLEGDVDSEIRRAWSERIASRAQQVLDGTAPTRDLDEALDELEARVRRAAG